VYTSKLALPPPFQNDDNITSQLEYKIFDTLAVLNIEFCIYHGSDHQHVTDELYIPWY
jgi:hypothetical protein